MSTNVDKKLMVEVINARLEFMRKHPEAATGSELRDLVACAVELFKWRY